MRLQELGLGCCVLATLTVAQDSSSSSSTSTSLGSATTSTSSTAELEDSSAARQSSPSTWPQSSTSSTLQTTLTTTSTEEASSWTSSASHRTTTSPSSETLWQTTTTTSRDGDTTSSTSFQPTTSLQPTTSAPDAGPTDPSPYAAAQACNIKSLSWKSKQVITSTFIGLTSGLQWLPTILGAPGIMPYTTLCDGVPRAKGNMTSTMVYPSTNTWSTTKTITSTVTNGEPAPNCKITEEECLFLYNSYTAALNSAYESSKALPTRPACTKYATCTNEAASPNSDSWGCYISGFNVEIAYWPTSVKGLCDDRKTITNSWGPQTATVWGTTVTSPAVLVSFDRLYAFNGCGNVGTEMRNYIMSQNPEQISTQCGLLPRGSGEKVDFGDWQSPIPHSVFQCQPDCGIGVPSPFWGFDTAGPTTGGLCSTIFEDHFSPNIAVPTDVFKLQPAWRDCEAQPLGNVLRDPPVALQIVSRVAAPTKPAENVPAYTTPIQPTVPSLNAPTAQATPTSGPMQQASIGVATVVAGSSVQTKLDSSPGPAASGSASPVDPPAIEQGAEGSSLLTMDGPADGAPTRGNLPLDSVKNEPTGPPFQYDPASRSINLDLTQGQSMTVIQWPSPTTTPIGDMIAAGIGMSKPSATTVIPSKDVTISWYGTSGAIAVGAAILSVGDKQTVDGPTVSIPASGTVVIANYTTVTLAETSRTSASNSAVVVITKTAPIAATSSHSMTGSLPESGDGKTMGSTIQTTQTSTRSQPPIANAAEAPKVAWWTSSCMLVSVYFAMYHIT